MTAGNTVREIDPQNSQMSDGSRQIKIKQGHLRVSYGSCHDLLLSTMTHEPPHDITHRQAGSQVDDLTATAMPLRSGRVSN
jgi:hypothetical protein